MHCNSHRPSRPLLGALLAVLPALTACAAARAQDGDPPATPGATSPAPPTSPSTAPAAPALAPGDHERSLTHQERSRRYLVHGPPAARGTAPLPVLLVFHGGGGEPVSMERMCGFDPIADREGFLAVYPDGTGLFPKRLHTFNAGGCCGYAQDHDVDDVGFTVAILEDLAQVAPVDATRVYATGFSNGGMMTYRVAAALSERIAAAAPVSGAMVYAPPAPPARAVPILHIHSEDDPRALYEGGLGPPFPFTNRRVQHAAVADAIAQWVAWDGCPREPAVEAETRGVEGTREAAHRAQRFVYGPGRDGVEVVLWRLRGPGHTWPGIDGVLPERLVGPPTHMIDAAEEIWRFLRRWRRADAPALTRPR